MEGHLTGASEVLDVIAERVRSGSRPGRRSDGFRVALAIEGGVVRGAVTGGMGLELHERGLLAAVDDVYGSSAGAITGAWLTSSRPQGLIGWTEPAYTRMLIRPHAPLRRRPLVDVQALAEVVYTRHAPLDFPSVLASPIRWHPLATDAHTGRAVDLRPMLHQPPDVQLAIRATAAIPVLTGPPVLLAGRGYVDAGVAEPVPVFTAARQGVTHVLVLRSRRADDLPRPSRLTAAVARTLIRSHGPGLRAALVSASRRYLDTERLLDGRVLAAASWPVTASLRPGPDSPIVSRFSTDRIAVTAAFDAGRAAVADVFAGRNAAPRDMPPGR